MHLQHCTLISCPPLTIQKLNKKRLKLCIWELSPKQEKDSVIPDPDPRPKPSPKMEEQDHSPHQDIIPTPDMIPALEQDSIDSNLLEDNQNQQFVIDREHNLGHRTFPPSDALAADAIIVIKTRRH